MGREGLWDLLIAAKDSILNNEAERLRIAVERHGYVTAENLGGAGWLLSAGLLKEDGEVASLHNTKEYYWCATERGERVYREIFGWGG